MTLYHDRFRVESARHPAWDYHRPGWYFVTICTRGHRCDFGRIRSREMFFSELGLTAQREWLQIPAHYERVALDAFVVMPNHLHGIVVLQKDSAGPLQPPSLGSIVGCYKAGVSRWARANVHLGFAWQARFYDRIIRGDSSLAAMREYIAANPENWFHDEFYRSA